MLIFQYVNVDTHTRLIYSYNVRTKDMTSSNFSTAWSIGLTKRGRLLAVDVVWDHNEEEDYEYQFYANQSWFTKDNYFSANVQQNLVIGSAPNPTFTYGLTKLQNSSEYLINVYKLCNGQGYYYDS